MPFSRESGLFTLKTLTLAALIVFSLIAVRAGIGLKEAQRERDAASPSQLVNPPETTLEIRVGDLSWNFRCEAADSRPVCYNVELLLRGTDVGSARSRHSELHCPEPVPVSARGLLRGQEVSLSGRVCPDERASAALLGSLFAIAPQELHNKIAAELYSAERPGGGT